MLLPNCRSTFTIRTNLPSSSLQKIMKMRMSELFGEEFAIASFFVHFYTSFSFNSLKDNFTAFRLIAIFFSANTFSTVVCYDIIVFVSEAAASWQSMVITKARCVSVMPCMRAHTQIASAMHPTISSTSNYQVLIVFMMWC